MAFGRCGVHRSPVSGEKTHAPAPASQATSFHFCAAQGTKSAMTAISGVQRCFRSLRGKSPRHSRQLQT